MDAYHGCIARLAVQQVEWPVAGLEPDAAVALALQQIAATLMTPQLRCRIHFTCINKSGLISLVQPQFCRGSRFLSMLSPTAILIPSALALDLSQTLNYSKLSGM